MNKKITVIITIRNREPWRIQDQIISIRTTGANPAFHIVDYGSDLKYSIKYKLLCNELNLNYTYMYTQGLPWNKCHAINYGAKTATTPFIVTSDVDMIYDGNPFQWCLDNYQEKTMYHMETYWLPKSGKKEKAKYAGHGNPGGFQFINKNAFIEIGGYDEQIVYWGLEDIDWPNRLISKKYTQKWLPQQFKIYHQWHKQSVINYNRPITATFNTYSYLWQNSFQPILTQNWGSPLFKENRPILNYIKTKTPQNIELKTNELQRWHRENPILSTKKKNAFIKINLSPRLKKRPLDIFRQITKKILKPITALTGTQITENLNQNFDYFYALLPLFKQNGLRDYYITDDVSTIYLLWE